MDENRDGTFADADGWVAVCTVAQVAAEGIVRVRVGDLAVLVFRDGGGMVACERACPHEQADLALGSIRDGRLHCPRHQASFGLRDGRISAGWTCRALRVFQVRIQAGEVWLDRRTDGSDPMAPSRH
jgi:3-phenylpropionate/trans-cinnamate dioxygenase ferredoxin subunit